MLPMSGALCRASTSAGSSILLSSFRYPSLYRHLASSYCQVYMESSAQQLKLLKPQQDQERLKKHSLTPSTTEDSPKGAELDQDHTVACEPRSPAHSPSGHLLETPKVFKTPNDDSLSKNLYVKSDTCWFFLGRWEPSFPSLFFLISSQGTKSSLSTVPHPHHSQPRTVLTWISGNLSGRIHTSLLSVSSSGVGPLPPTTPCQIAG